MARPEKEFLAYKLSEPEIMAKADQFMQLIFAPMQMRALMGENLSVLKKEIPAHISASIRLFMADGMLP